MERSSEGGADRRSAVKIVLACSECGHKGYRTRRRPDQKIELKKYCKECKRHTLHREAR